jgi:hypothetical protein
MYADYANAVVGAGGRVFQVPNIQRARDALDTLTAPVRNAYFIGHGEGLFAFQVVVLGDGSFSRNMPIDNFAAAPLDFRGTTLRQGAPQEFFSSLASCFGRCPAQTAHLVQFRSCFSGRGYARRVAISLGLLRRDLKVEVHAWGDYYELVSINDSRWESRIVDGNGTVQHRARGAAAPVPDQIACAANGAVIEESCR